jgi:beta-phosphoglucomutase-like phosphatase (HAD superfamily)
MSHSREPITPGRFDVVPFDVDGVLTSAATIHSSCRKTVSDDFPRHRAAEKDEAFRPSDIATDYKRDSSSPRGKT